MESAHLIQTAEPGRGLAAGFLHNTLGASPRMATVLTTVAIGGGLVLSLLNWLLTPSIDPREPPLLKPSIPFIGHIINLIRLQGEFHPALRKSNPSVPLATVPMLNGKIYTIFDPDLIQSALRSKAASFEPFVLDFARKSFGLSKTTFAKITNQPELMQEFTDAIHRSFHPKALAQMNLHFLQSILAKVDSIVDDATMVDTTNTGRERRTGDGTLEVGNLFLWCRDAMSLASTKALYGDSDPFSIDPTLVPDIWTFEQAVPLFLLSLFPSVTMPKGFQARARLQRVLEAYYEAENDINDPTISSLAYNRASKLRQFGFTFDEMAKLEAILPVVATTNAVPTFFWMLIFVLSRPSLVTRLRAELEAAASFDTNTPHGGSTATFDITKFDKQLPLMVSCYRETMRLVNHSVSMRRTTADINLTGADGKTYLLKKGVDVQMSAGVTHSERHIWGDDAGDFDPERFLHPMAVNGSSRSEEDRKKNTAFFPFGGGKHLCPGRNLAFCEILGFMALMLLRFDVEPVGMGFADLKMAGSKLSSPSCRPVNSGQGLGARISMRKGWETTRFVFTS